MFTAEEVSKKNLLDVLPQASEDDHYPYRVETLNQILSDSYKKGNDYYSLEDELLDRLTRRNDVVRPALSIEKNVEGEHVEIPNDNYAREMQGYVSPFRQEPTTWRAPNGWRVKVDKVFGVPVVTLPNEGSFWKYDEGEEAYTRYYGVPYDERLDELVGIHYDMKKAQGVLANYLEMPGEDDEDVVNAVMKKIDEFTDNGVILAEEVLDDIQRKLDSRKRNLGEGLLAEYAA